MLYLLQLNDAHERWWLPVAERTGAELERALLATDREEQQAILAAAIHDEPCLALWAVRMDDAIAKPETAANAARLLVDDLVERLASQGGPWGDPIMSGAFLPWHERNGPFGPLVCRRIDSWEAGRYSRELAEALRHARAAGSVTNKEQAVHDAAYFAALVAAASRFLASCPHEARTGTNLLPPFIPVPPPPPKEPVDSAAEHDELAAGFLGQVPDIEWRLPALVQKLSKFGRETEGFEERLEREKLTALKELAYGASHEINNPLANIAARAQTLLKEESDPERQRKLTAIHHQAMRAHEMIADLMLFARPPELILERCALENTVQQVVAELAEEAEQHQIQLSYLAPAESVTVRADATQLAVAVKAVITNAIEAVGANGHIEVSVRRHEANQGTWGVVQVRDGGPGMSEHARRHLFDPFFSGREAGRGLGFGLSKCWRIITEHGGYVHVDHAKPRGAEFVIALPVWNDTGR